MKLSIFSRKSCLSDSSPGTEVESRQWKEEETVETLHEWAHHWQAEHTDLEHDEVRVISESVMILTFIGHEVAAIRMSVSNHILMSQQSVHVTSITGGWRILHHLKMWCFKTDQFWRICIRYHLLIPINFENRLLVLRIEFNFSILLMVYTVFLPVGSCSLCSHIVDSCSSFQSSHSGWDPQDSCLKPRSSHPQ